MPRTLNEITDDIEQVEKTSRNATIAATKAFAASHGQTLPEDLFSDDMPMVHVLEDGRRLELRDLIAELRALADAS